MKSKEEEERKKSQHGGVGPAMDGKGGGKKEGGMGA